MRELLKNGDLEDVLEEISLNQIFDFISEIGEKAGIGTFSLNVEDFVINYVEYDGKMNRLKIAKIQRDDNKQMAFIENNMFRDIDYDSQAKIITLVSSSIQAFNEICDADEIIIYHY